MKLFHFVPECFVDTNLVESLLETDDVNHQKGCNSVVKTMKGKKLDGSFAVGIIDSDKRKPSYVNDFNEIAKSQHLSLMKHKEKSHYIIMINPAIDGFILDCAKDQGVDVNDFDLPSELKAFTKQTKNINSKKDERFKRLFKKLKDNPEFTIFRNVLIYLRDKNYNSTEESLIRLFQSPSI